MKIDGNILYAPCPCGSGKKFKFCCMQTVRGYHPPVRMHPLEYRAWLRAQLAFYVAVRDDVRADNTEDAIDRIEREFGLQA